MSLYGFTILHLVQNRPSDRTPESAMASFKRVPGQIDPVIEADYITVVKMTTSQRT